MKYFIAAILIFCNISSFSQVKDYFLPSEKYLSNTFVFISDTFVNDDGVHQSIKKVNYNLDPTGNYKKFISDTWYRYNVPKIKMNIYEFFNINNNNVTKIYHYVEGLSEELKNLGYIDNNDVNIIVLKYPPSKWIDNSDPDVTEYYKSEFGKLETKYATYNDCIIVTKTTKSKTSEFKSLEKYSQKYYYARNIGLIKSETYENGKLILIYGLDYGELVDDFSEYSKQVIAENNRIKVQTQAFLKLRKTTTYEYKKFHPNHTKEINKELTEYLWQISENKSIDNFNMSIEFRIDTAQKTTSNINFSGITNESLKKEIQNKIESIKLKPVIKNNYTLNSKLEFSFNFNKTYTDYDLKYTKSTLTLNVGNGNEFSTSKNYINNYFVEKKNPYGFYDIQLSNNLLNGEQRKNIIYKSYKSYAGPASAFASLFIPGLGDRLVTGGEKFGYGKTLVVYSLVGIGAIAKISSNNMYDKYHSATTQSDIDKYYDSANNYNKASYFLFGAGALIWIHDIIWVAKRGSENKRAEKDFGSKINLTFNKGLNKNYQVGLTYNF